MANPNSETISVIIAAFNEVQSLEGVVLEIESELTKTGRNCEMVIVDDGSTDGTSDLADRLATQHPLIRVVHQGINKGLGEVYRTGFEQARCDYIIFLPADGQFPASVISQFVPLMKDMDLVLGYLPESRRSPFAKILSLGEKILYRLLFGKMPKFQGALMFRRALLSRFKLHPSGRSWAILMEFLIKATRSGCRHISVPTTVRIRKHGESKVNNLATIWVNLKDALMLRRHL